MNFHKDTNMLPTLSTNLYSFGFAGLIQKNILLFLKLLCYNLGQTKRRNVRQESERGVCFIMAKITLHSDSSTSATSVSNIFIDEYMSGANGEFVKIYLYLLRLMNAPDTAFSISSIADKFEHTEKDIRRALSYWERMHLLRLEYDSSQNLTGVCLLNSMSVPQETKAPSASRDAAANVNISAASDAKPGTPKMPAVRTDPSAPQKKEYTPDDIRMFRQDDSIAELFFITERYLGRTLSATDINTILYLYDSLGFSAALIEYLVEYCVSNGHISIRYIEKVALGWSGSGISTVEEAKQAAGIHGKFYFAVMKALGISGRNLVSSETDLIEKWKSEYGFTIEIISEACRRTIQSIHQPSFEYTDTILSSWYKNHIHSPDDIKRLDEAFQSQKKGSASPAPQAASKNKFNNFKQRSYDYDQLEKMLLTTAPK